MPTLTYTAAACLGLAMLVAGLLTGWAWVRRRTSADHVPLAVHRDELTALRRRYRQRLRALRDAAARVRASEAALRAEARTAAEHHRVQERLLTGARAEAATLRERVAALERANTAHREEATLARAREEAAREALRGAQARLATSEQDHGLLRIERDELAARTERLRALPAAGADVDVDVPAPAPAGASRAEIADRDARIHELECVVRERDARLGELESTLRTWKYRIAPIALHVERQRERKAKAQAAQSTQAAPAAPPPADDLKRIRGVGGGLEKKLRGAGVATFAQLAAMSPAELANLAVRLGLAASRPQRDDWSGQAVALLARGGVRQDTREDGRHADSA